MVDELTNWADLVQGVGRALLAVSVTNGMRFAKIHKISTHYYVTAVSNNVRDFINLAQNEFIIEYNRMQWKTWK